MFDRVRLLSVIGVDVLFGKTVVVWFNGLVVLAISKQMDVI